MCSGGCMGAVSVVSALLLPVVMLGLRGRVIGSDDMLPLRNTYNCYEYVKECMCVYMCMCVYVCLCVIIYYVCIYLYVCIYYVCVYAYR
jgi:hypothetical protein